MSTTSIQEKKYLGKKKTEFSDDCVCLWREKRCIIIFFFFLFDRLKEHWLIGLSDATFNEQRGRTVGGKLAWSSFCRTELMKPLWIKAGVCCGSWLMCSSNTSHFTKKMFYENQEWKGSPVSLCNAIKLPLMRLSGTIIIRPFNITS